MSNFVNNANATELMNGVKDKLDTKTGFSDSVNTTPITELIQVLITKEDYALLTPEQKNDPTKIYILTNDTESGGGGAVDTVNGMTGDVILTASDVGALPDDTEIPSKTSDLDNDSNFVADASYVHTDNNYDATAKGIVDGVTAALAGKVDKETGKSLIDLTTVVDGASYDSTNHLILFKNGTTTLFSLDAAAFVKDGMVDTVTITGGNLVITFNTDAGKQAMSIPITDIFDPANYYDKTATDNLLADKVSKSNTAGLLKNDGTVDTNTYATTSQLPDITGKADKVSGATNGNFAGLDANGNLTDSGKKAADFQSVIPEVFTGDLNTLSARGFHQYIAAYTDLSNAPTVSYTVNKCYIDVWSDGAGNVCQIIKLVGLTYDPAAKYCDIYKRSCYSTGSALSWGAWEKLNGKQNAITQSSLLTLTVAGWDSTTLQQTVTFAHDTTKRNVIDITLGEMTTWGECGVRAVSETATGITFECDEIPETALTFTVTSMEVG